MDFVSIAITAVVLLCAVAIVVSLNKLQKRKPQELVGLSCVVLEVVDEHAVKVKVHSGTRAFIMKSESNEAVVVGEHMIVDRIVDSKTVAVRPIIPL